MWYWDSDSPGEVGTLVTLEIVGITGLGPLALLVLALGTCLPQVPVPWPGFPLLTLSSSLESTPCVLSSFHLSHHGIGFQGPLPAP